GNRIIDFCQREYFRRRRYSSDLASQRFKRDADAAPVGIVRLIVWFIDESGFGKGDQRGGLFRVKRCAAWISNSSRLEHVTKLVDFQRQSMSDPGITHV